MSARDLMRKYAQWWLGDPSWGATFFDFSTRMYEAENKAKTGKP